MCELVHVYVFYLLAAALLYQHTAREFELRTYRGYVITKGIKFCKPHGLED